MKKNSCFLILLTHLLALSLLFAADRRDIKKTMNVKAKGQRSLPKALHVGDKLGVFQLKESKFVYLNIKKL